MGHQIKVRRGNSSGTRFITIPAEIADLYNIKIGTFLEIDTLSSDQFKVTVLKSLNVGARE